MSAKRRASTTCIPATNAVSCRRHVPSSTCVPMRISTDAGETASAVHATSFAAATSASHGTSTVAVFQHKGHIHHIVKGSVVFDVMVGGVTSQRQIRRFVG